MDGLTERLAAVRMRIARAADRAHRDPASILLLAVTKIFPAEAIQDAYALGLREFGENYVQEFEGKAPSVSGLAGRAISPDRPPAVQQGSEGGGVVPGDPDRGFGKTRPPLERGGTPPRRHAGGQTERRGSQERRRSRRRSGVNRGRQAATPICASAGLMTMPPWSEDPEAPRACFRRAARTGGDARAERAFHGHVQRPRNRHRRGLHLRPRGHGTVRQAEEGVMPQEVGHR